MASVCPIYCYGQYGAFWYYYAMNCATQQICGISYYLEMEIGECDANNQCTVAEIPLSGQMPTAVPAVAKKLFGRKAFEPFEHESGHVLYPAYPSSEIDRAEVIEPADNLTFRPVRDVMVIDEFAVRYDVGEKQRRFAKVVVVIIPEVTPGLIILRQCRKDPGSTKAVAFDADGSNSTYDLVGIDGHACPVLRYRDKR